MIQVVLFNPKIPQNTGAIGRTCVATNSALHIIGPIPFEITDKNLKRAGMDYWVDLKYTYWDSLQDFINANPIDEKHYFFTTKTKQNFFNADFVKDCFLWFGPEDAGLPAQLIQEHNKQTVRVPMTGNYRSLNLANTVSIGVYEALRQNQKEYEWLKF